MKDALYIAIACVGYGMGLLGVVSSTEKMSITTAFNYNFIGGLIVFLFYSLIYYGAKNPNSRLLTVLKWIFPITVIFALGLWKYPILYSSEGG